MFGPDEALERRGDFSTDLAIEDRYTSRGDSVKTEPSLRLRSSNNYQ
jgi:hypothetical protein